uniref:TNFR-Cys domain-containing protein n=1 Tax=Sphaeramia orbicularis TaxID=375764 RepID=A0A673BPN4_9TELE
RLNMCLNVRLDNLGTQLVCDKCPAGTYVSVHCSPTAVRECSPCPEGTFTRGENGVEQCHRCQAPCTAGFIEKIPCTSTQDAVCTCPPNSYLSGDGGTQCKPHSLCPPGTRVKTRGTDTKDVGCKPCNKGTFSDVESSALKCRCHTDCQETDNICGPSSAASISPSSSSHSTMAAQAVLVQEPNLHRLHHWHCLDMDRKVRCGSCCPYLWFSKKWFETRSRLVIVVRSYGYICHPLSTSSFPRLLSFIRINHGCEMSALLLFKNPSVTFPLLLFIRQACSTQSTGHFSESALHISVL